jgi:hypothetical protein
MMGRIKEGVAVQHVFKKTVWDVISDTSGVFVGSSLVHIIHLDTEVFGTGHRPHFVNIQ